MKILVHMVTIDYIMIITIVSIVSWLQLPCKQSSSSNRNRGVDLSSAELCFLSLKSFATDLIDCANLEKNALFITNYFIYCVLSFINYHFYQYLLLLFIIILI